jgi:hypothetical protein
MKSRPTSFASRIPLLVAMSVLAAALYAAFRALGGAPDMSMPAIKKEVVELDSSQETASA